MFNNPTTYALQLSAFCAAVQQNAANAAAPVYDQTGMHIGAAIVDFAVLIDRLYLKAGMQPRTGMANIAHDSTSSAVKLSGEGEGEGEGEGGGECAHGIMMLVPATDLVDGAAAAGPYCRCGGQTAVRCFDSKALTTIKASDAPAFILLNPRACGQVCEQAVIVWDLAATKNPTMVWAANCEDGSVPLCDATAGQLEPLIMIWDGAAMKPYDGPKHPERMLDHLDAVATKSMTKRIKAQNKKKKKDSKKKKAAMEKQKAAKALKEEIEKKKAAMEKQKAAKALEEETEKKKAKATMKDTKKGTKKKKKDKKKKKKEAKKKKDKKKKKKEAKEKAKKGQLKNTKHGDRSLADLTARERQAHRCLYTDPATRAPAGADSVGNIARSMLDVERRSGTEHPLAGDGSRDRGLEGSTPINILSLTPAEQRCGAPLDATVTVAKTLLRSSGYVVLRNAIPKASLRALRDALEDGIDASMRHVRKERIPEGTGFQLCTLPLARHYFAFYSTRAVLWGGATSRASGGLIYLPHTNDPVWQMR